MRSCRGEHCTYKLPFSFIIPNELISAHSDVPSTFLKLCPTTKVGLTFSDPFTGQIYGQPAITYALKIKRIRTEIPIIFSPRSCNEREIIVKPYISDAPPVELSHFPREYLTKVTTPLWDHWWKRSFGFLSVMAMEPSPLNICTSSPRSSTAAVLKLTFTHPLGFSQTSLSKPCEWRYLVKYYIRSRTYYSTHPLDHVPTIGTVSSNPNLQVRNTKTISEVRESGILRWSQHSHAEFNLGTRPLADGSTNVAVPLHSGEDPYNVTDGIHWFTTLTTTISAAKTMLPTFNNQLSSRQYALVLRLALKGLHHKSIELVIPLQVIYYASASTSECFIGNGHYNNGCQGDEASQPLEESEFESHRLDANNSQDGLLQDIDPPLYDEYCS